MKSTQSQYLVSFICPHCSDLHRQILVANDMSDAFKKALDGNAVSFDIVANPDNEHQPTTSPTLFYEEGGKIHARIFPYTTPITEVKAFSESCVKTRKFRGFLSTNQAIYTRNGD